MENEREKLLDEAVQQVLSFLAEKKYVDARAVLLKFNEVDISEILSEVMDSQSPERAVILFRTLPKDISVEVFSYLDVDEQLAIINVITDKELLFILDELAFDDMIDMLEELPANIVDKILVHSTKEERKQINTFLNYPDNSAGSLMTPDYIELRDDMTVAEALNHIRMVGMDSETVYTCYVKDNARTLKGIISLRSLVVKEGDIPIRDLMHTDFVYVNVYDDQEEVSNTFKKYGFLAIPVLDKEHRLVGIITVDDILDIIDEENTEDIERMAGVIDSTDKEYLDQSVFQHVKARIPWLFFLMISLMITGAIISKFEVLLSQVLCLVSYLPLIMGTGGNSGSQSATLVIRGMAIGEIELRDVLRVIWKELRVSFLVGLTLSILNFAKILLIDGESALVALTVCASILVVVMLAKTIGSMLPMLAKKLGIDPALMASPMIASTTDMISVITYFALASVILGI